MYRKSLQIVQSVYYVSKGQTILLLTLPLQIPGKAYSSTQFNSIARHVEDVEYGFVMYILCATTTES